MAGESEVNTLNSEQEQSGSTGAQSDGTGSLPLAANFPGWVIIIG